MEHCPVCGMEIERDEAAAQSTYEDQTYYFCSAGCRDEFEKNPERYAEQEVGR
jgi:YHS domain-containing protein